MKASKVGIDLIHSWERFRNYAYQDSGGVWTAGWGSTKIKGRPVRKGDIVTRGQGDTQFRVDLERFEQAVTNLVSVPVNQNQFDALVSLTYNIGEGNLSKSKVLKYLNESKYIEAANAFMNHIYARHRKTGELLKLKGLERRRKAERELFLTPESGHHLEDLIKELKPRPIEKLTLNWHFNRYEQI